MNIYGFVPNYFLLQDPTIPIQVMAEACGKALHFGRPGKYSQS